jgi:hypothetical protein
MLEVDLRRKPLPVSEGVTIAEREYSFGKSSQGVRIGDPKGPLKRSNIRKKRKIVYEWS